MLRTWSEIEFLPFCRFPLRRKRETRFKTGGSENPTMRTSFRLTPSLSPSLCSAVSGNDHQAEADWAAGAVPMLPRRGGGDFGVGLLALQPPAGPQGDLQLRENSGGALPRCQPDWGTAQGNTPFSYHSSRKTVRGLLMVSLFSGIFFSFRHWNLPVCIS